MSGVGLWARGPLELQVAPVQAACRTPWAWLATVGNSRHRHTTVVPLCKYCGTPYQPRERTTLSILCRFLAHRPDLRPRLHDVTRMNALVAELCAGAQADLEAKIYFRRNRIKIRRAMTALGLVHPWGRPIPGQPPKLDQNAAANAVSDYMTSHRLATRGITRNEIEATLKEEYFSVAPWPFFELIR